MTMEVTTIPRVRRRVLSDTKANLDALTSLFDGDLGYATDETVLYRQDGDGAASWVAITSHATEGEGHISILLSDYESIGQGTWAADADVDNVIGFFKNTSLNDADNVSYKIYLAKGTYTLRWVGLKHSAAGIMDIDLDAAEIATFDLYDAASVHNSPLTETGIVVAASGLKTLRVRCDGKNGASTNFSICGSTIALWRTA